MKIKSFLAMMLAAVTFSFSAISCGDDDDDEAVQTSAAQMAVGTYTGDMTVTVMGSESAYEDVQFTITADGDNTIRLVTAAAGEGAMALPALTVEALAVTKSTQEGVEVVTASVDELAGTIVVNETEKSYTFTDLNIVVVPSTKKAVITYSLQYGKMPMAMVMSFTGTAE